MTKVVSRSSVDHWFFGRTGDGAFVQQDYLNRENC
jgi:hypothetical protein